jgi:hypothetical protein
LEHTNALLDKYVNILSKSEAVTRLIFDERWEGADQVTCEHFLMNKLSNIAFTRTKRSSSADKRKLKKMRAEKLRYERFLPSGSANVKRGKPKKLGNVRIRKGSTRSVKRE